MSKMIYVGACGCGSQIWDEVERVECPKCGTVYMWSIRERRKMTGGGCGNCGALIFGTIKSKSLAAPNTSEIADFRKPDGTVTS